VWVNSPVDWRSYRILQLKASYYGLDEYFDFITPETEADLTNAIVQAYENGDPVVAYYWEPTWLMGKYDLVLLEEPEYTEECWAEMVVAIDQEPLGSVSQACAFPTYDIHKGIYGGLLEEAPELVVFIKNMFVGTQRVNELAAYMADNEAEPEEVAIYYLKNYENEWKRWVPDDIAEKVKTSLP
jgi:glycine betaine/proline transport system substrate-binding protein